MEKAEVLLSMNHGLARLDNVWGIGGGNRPVRYLTNRVSVEQMCVGGDGWDNNSNVCLDGAYIWQCHTEALQAVIID